MVQLSFRKLLTLLLGAGVIVLLAESVVRLGGTTTTKQFSLGVLHTDDAASATLESVLRRLTFAHPELGIIVVDGTNTQSNSSSYVHPNLHFERLTERTGASGCYNRLLTIADSKFLFVLKSTSLDVNTNIAVEMEHLLQYVVDKPQQSRDPGDEKTNGGFQSVILFVPSPLPPTNQQQSKSYKFKFSPQEIPNTAYARYSDYAVRNFRKRRLSVVEEEFEKPKKQCDAADSVPSLICRPTDFISPEFGFLASLDDLKSLPTIPEYAWALDSHALAMQWFARNVSVEFCESSCQSSTSSPAPVLSDRRHSIANVSALALCDIVPDVGAIVLPDISIDCNLGFACTQADPRRKLDEDAGDRFENPCIDDSNSKQMYMMGPTGAHTINCGQLHRAFDAASHNEPFARGAHKAVYLGSYHGLPMVIKQLFIVNDDDDPEHDDDDLARAAKKKKKNRDGDNDDRNDNEQSDQKRAVVEPRKRMRTNVTRTKDEVSKFAKTFERQVLDEFYYVNKWEPNSLHRNPFVMQLYGTCVGVQHGANQLVAAEGPLLTWKGAVRSDLDWATRLALAINLTLTLDFLASQRVVLCGLNKEQVAIDDEWNVKLIDLDTLVEHPKFSPTERLGQGMQCSTNRDCARVEAHRYTSFVEPMPDRSQETIADDGSLVLWFKPGRAGSRGTIRHRTCLPNVNECRCNSTNVCEGVDGVTMLAASVVNMIRPMLDRSQYVAPSSTFNHEIELVLAKITPKRDCGTARDDTPARAAAILREFAEQQGAFEVLARNRPTRRARHAQLVEAFIAHNSHRCQMKGDGRKCAG